MGGKRRVTLSSTKVPGTPSLRIREAEPPTVGPIHQPEPKLLKPYIERYPRSPCRKCGGNDFTPSEQQHSIVYFTCNECATFKTIMQKREEDDEPNDYSLRIQPEAASEV